MKFSLSDGRTLCALPDALHRSLYLGVLRYGLPVPERVAYADGPFLFDPTTAHNLVYHIRGDIYCAESQCLYAYGLLNGQTTQTTQPN